MDSIKNLIKRKFRKPGAVSGIGLPSEVILELTNKCNLRCIMCHIHSPHVSKKRAEGFMEEQLWKKVIDEISLWDHQVNLNTFGAGETLLHPSIIDIIKYAKSKKNITAGFLTNGMLLDRNKVINLLHAGADWIAVSLDGTEAEVVEKYRKGSNLLTIEANIECLVNERGNDSRPYIKLNMVQLPEVVPQEVEFLKKWMPLVDEVMLSKYRPLGAKSFLDSRLQRKPCFILNKMMVIAWDGNVGLCCEDNFIEHKMGNVNDNDLKTIWQGREFQKVRGLHQKGLYHEIPLCKDCDVWSTDSVLNEFIDENGYAVREYTSQKVFKKR